jgi:Cupin domain
MQRDAFLAQLKQQGFPEPSLVERAANGFVDTHSHPFEAQALILSGEIRLRVGDAERVYRVGDVFHLSAHEPHAEWYGPQGVSYLAGRK